MSRTDSVVFGGTEIKYTIQRTNRRKSIAITVHPDASVTVAAPKGTRRTLIAKKVQDKAEWVIRQNERLCRNGRHSQKDYVSGETFRYLGRQYQLKVQGRSTISASGPASLLRGCLVVPVPARSSTAYRRSIVRKALLEWYRERAAVQIQKVVDRYARRLGVGVKRVEIREMKTRWGSAGSRSVVRFNWRIVMAPMDLLEYVVAHELCHIRYHDHSRHFWRLLQLAIPNYGQRRERLESMGPLLTI